MSSPYGAWKNGPSTDPSYFPIGVWYQHARNARAYAGIGVNMYMAVDGDLEKQLPLLRQAGIRAITGQGKRGLAHRDDPTIMAWMHGDEPDNAQPVEGGGWGPAIPTSKTISDYQEMKAKDLTRPVLLNLGQGVANDEWVGIGCTPDAYPEYVQGCDIVSFDIYPVVGDNHIVPGAYSGEDYLWYVAQGVDRLRQWGCGERIVWNIIECTHISNPAKLATPHQVKAMAWMSLVHGSRSITYFCHQFQPTLDEAALLADAEMSAAVKAINQQIHALAPVLNSPSLPDTAATATSTNPCAPIDIVAKRLDGAHYLFAVNMRNQPTQGLFRVTELRKRKINGRVEVIGEGRSIEATEGRFTDGFAPYDVHLYRVAAG